MAQNEVFDVKPCIHIKAFPKWLHLFFFLLLGIYSCKKKSLLPTESYIYGIPVQTGDGWETADLNTVGMDESHLIDLIHSIKNGTYKNIHSILIVKDGKLVFEEYFWGRKFNLYLYTRTQIWWLYSQVATMRIPYRMKTYLNVLSYQQSALLS